VKTRLIGALTAAEAADLHQAFVEDLLSRLQGRTFDLQVAWAVESGELLPSTGVQSFRQQGVDLGERLFRGLRHVGRLYDKVAAVGSDHPEIPVALLEEAFARLDEHQVVIGPARDGGYYLIAARAPCLAREIFNGIDWSTDRVLAQTIEQCAGAGLDVFLLPEGDDVDSPEDFERLRRILASEPHDCRRTEMLLREWGML